MWRANEEPKPPPSDESIGRVVLIAGLSAVAAGLAAWAVDELREVFGTKPKCGQCNKPLEEKVA